jgi:hypothetical protein
MMDESQEQSEPVAKPRKRLPKTAVLIAIVSVVEGGIFFGVMKMFGGGPQVAHGATEGDNVLHGESPAQNEKGSSVEVELLQKFRVPNDKSGRLFIYDFDLSVKVSSKRKEEIEKLVSERKGELSDRVARIVRGNDPAVLNEADLKTIRTLLRNAIGELAGDPEIVQEVLIPRCVPIRSD